VVTRRGRPTRRGSRAIDPSDQWDENGSAVAALRATARCCRGRRPSPEFGRKGLTGSPLYGSRAIDDGVAGTRVAFSPDLGYVSVDPEVAAAVDRAAGALAELGAHVARVDPGFADPREFQETLWPATCVKIMADLGYPSADVFDPGFAKVAAAGRADLARGLPGRHEAARRARHAREPLPRRVGLLVTPTLPIPAFAACRVRPLAGNGSASARR
jgi:Asp-tRNA(Asn)/Glu-tRNA(Gln) amidotransferase A subunit family amidase